MSNDWKIQTNTSDYLSQQKRRGDIEVRRPTIRQASDLVGPGIGAAAIRITDFNNLLATFNGYYSAAAGALSAPNDSEAFVGQVVSDAELGGRQIFTGLTSGVEYSRTFTRSPTDPETLGWGVWSGQRIPVTAQGYTVNQTLVPAAADTILLPPNLDVVKDPAEIGVYSVSPAGIRILRQGVYTGMIQVGANSLSAVVDSVTVRRPDGLTTTQITNLSVPLGPTYHYPFTVWASDENQGFGVSVSHSLPGTGNRMWWRFTCTRIGDAV